MAPMKRPSLHQDKTVQSLSLLQVAHRWGKSRRQIRQMLKQGKLPFEQVRGQLRVPLDAVCQFEAEHFEMGRSSIKALDS